MAMDICVACFNTDFSLAESFDYGTYVTNAMVVSICGINLPVSVWLFARGPYEVLDA